MTGKVAAITSYLRGFHIKVPNEWVEACVDWLQEEHESSGESLSLEKLKKLVYEQWLVADLTELGIQVLPPQVASAEKYSLSGHFCLQVNSMIDISASYYSQQVKLKGIDTTNSGVTFDEPKKATWQPPITRMMKLELTDGTTKVYAMEYNTIPDLKPELKPGFKVLIEGSVLCRKGMMMLKRENLRVLGGEVDSLMEANTPQTLLTKAMQDSAAYAGESMRREFTAADDAEFADRIHTPGFKKKGYDLPGTHNTKAGNSSKYVPGKSTSWNSKDSSQKSWKPKLSNFEDISEHSNTGADDFDDEWEADDLEFLDDAVMANSQQPPSSPTFSESSSLGQTPQQQQKNKKRSFSPYEVNDSSILPKKKNTRLSPSFVPGSSTMSNNERLSQSSEIDDGICVDNWDDDEMEMAMAMDMDLNRNSHSGPSSKKSSSAGGSIVQNKKVSEDYSSPSSSRPCQLSGSLVRPGSVPEQTIKQNTDNQLKSSSITVNSSVDDIMNKWLELCKKKVKNPDAYSNLMKVEPVRMPFTYLFVLQGCQMPENSSKFRIKGYVSTLLGKLERTGQKWKLMCTLNDGTGTLPVQLSDEVLTQLIGYTVQQSIEMTSSGSDPSLKKKLQEGVKQCQLKIVNLCSIFEIETSKNCSHPLVTKIMSINAGHVQQLRRQVTGALTKV